MKDNFTKIYERLDELRLMIVMVLFFVSVTAILVILLVLEAI